MLKDAWITRAADLVELLRAPSSFSEPNSPQLVVSALLSAFSTPIDHPRHGVVTATAQ
jgi:hypothetical protein